MQDVTIPVLRQIRLMRPQSSFLEEYRPVRSKMSGRPMGPEVRAILIRLPVAELQKLANTQDSIAWSTDFEPDGMDGIFFLIYAIS